MRSGIKAFGIVPLIYFERDDSFKTVSLFGKKFKKRNWRLYIFRHTLNDYWYFLQIFLIRRGIYRNKILCKLFGIKEWYITVHAPFEKNVEALNVNFVYNEEEQSIIGRIGLWDHHHYNAYYFKKSYFTGSEVDKLCRVLKEVEPKHIFLGTPKDDLARKEITDFIDTIEKLPYPMTLKHLEYQLFW